MARIACVRERTIRRDVCMYVCACTVINSVPIPVAARGLCLCTTGAEFANGVCRHNFADNLITESVRVKLINYFFASFSPSSPAHG